MRTRRRDTTVSELVGLIAAFQDTVSCGSRTEHQERRPDDGDT
jgi:hypothetical protein